jgi:Kdo2-lipid IVA lauroyltransferase/acyltransferase
VSKTESPRLTRFLGPRYWHNWLGLGVLWLLTRLPYRSMLQAGRSLGRLGLLLARHRTGPARTNLALCFPELTAEQREGLLRRHYESLGMGVLEIALSWWAPDERLRPLAREIVGIEHLHSALERGRGAILLGGHFTNLEIGGRLLDMHVPFNVVYRHLKNPLFDAVMKRSREAHIGKAIHRNDIRGMLRSLKANVPVWYAADQNYSGKHFVFAPFFGIPAATNSATARLARASGAPVIPFFQRRLADQSGYQLVLSAPIEDFPSDDVEADIRRVNEALEAQIRMAPEQYLWVHRRFKTRPEGEPDLYAQSPA